jgi:hypothetical protein
MHEEHLRRIEAHQATSLENVVIQWCAASDKQINFDRALLVNEVRGRPRRHGALQTVAIQIELVAQRIGERARLRRRERDNNVYVDGRSRFAPTALATESPIE